MRAHEAGALHAEGYGGPPHWLPWPADVIELVPQLWAPTVGRDEQGRLTVGGVDVRELAREFGTPAYVLDEADFRARARASATRSPPPFAELGGVDVYYAGKAFLCTEVARWVHEEGLRLDICTGGELAVALRAGFPRRGSACTATTSRRRARAGARRSASAGSSSTRSTRSTGVADVAAELGVRAPVMVRVTVGVEAHTHEFIATAHEDQKFGLSLSRRPGRRGGRRILAPARARPARAALAHRLADLRHRRVRGRRPPVLALHARGRDGARRPAPRARPRRRLRHRLHDRARPARRRASSPSRWPTGRRELRQWRRRPRHAAAAHLDRARPGHRRAGTFTLYAVGTVKAVDLDGGAQRAYVSVDGGMSDNIRTALYDADYSAHPRGRRSDAAPVLARVVGKHCESGDIVVHGRVPARRRRGRRPARRARHRRLLPVHGQPVQPRAAPAGGRGGDGQARVLVRRETEDDLLALDLG